KCKLRHGLPPLPGLMHPQPITTGRMTETSLLGRLIVLEKGRSNSFGQRRPTGSTREMGMGARSRCATRKSHATPTDVSVSLIRKRRCHAVTQAYSLPLSPAHSAVPSIPAVIAPIECTQPTCQRHGPTVAQLG